MSAISETLKELGVTKVRFYYHTSPLVNNIFTACLLVNDKDEVLGRGISICSARDVYRKREGKNKAMGRAIRAIVRQENSEPIKLRTDRYEGQKIRRIMKIKQKEIPQTMALLNASLVQIKENPAAITKRANKIGKIIFDVPLMYPLTVTSKFFKNKSEFKPKLHKFEEEYLKTINERKVKKDEEKTEEKK